jgi:hypothetical protein
MASTTYRPESKEDRRDDEGWDKAKQSGHEAKEAGKDALGKVKEAGSQAVSKAGEAMQSVGSMASETASTVGKKADDLTAAAGHGVAALGETIAEHTPHEGITGRVSQAVAGTIKESGKYIEEHKLSGMVKEVEQVVKNHPIPALLIVLGLGFCLARALRD